jgi:hypothetical protein
MQLPIKVDIRPTSNSIYLRDKIRRTSSLVPRMQVPGSRSRGPRRGVACILKLRAQRTNNETDEYNLTFMGSVCSALWCISHFIHVPFTLRGYFDMLRYNVCYLPPFNNLEPVRSYFIRVLSPLRGYLCIPVHSPFFHPTAGLFSV